MERSRAFLRRGLAALARSLGLAGVARSDTVPEERLLSKETRARVGAAIETLPPVQRQVITLRDVEGLGSGGGLRLLGISEVNQRVLLHRARSKVRGALEEYFAQV